MDNFDKKFQKHVVKTLNKDVPNPYKKNLFLSLPLWARISIPVGTLAVAASVAVAIIVPNIVSKNGDITASLNEANNNIEEEIHYDSLPNEGILPACAPKNTRTIPNLERNFVDRTGLKTIQNLESYFKDEKNTNCVLSPASYLLTMSAVAAVSDNFNLDAFGLEDPGEDTKYFLESLNCSYSTSNDFLVSKIDAGILHQQVGPKFKFVEEKRQQVADDYISTAVANKGNYTKQAEEYFKEHVGINIPIPELKLPGDFVATYGALSLIDKSNTFKTENNNFYIDGNPTSIPTASLGTESAPKTTTYYQTDEYLAFTVNINATNLVIVLPNQDVSLESISLSDVYSACLDRRNFESSKVFGYLPYFHLRSYSVDLTENVKSVFTGDELLYSKLLQDGNAIENPIIQCLQSSDFEFSESGIVAQSVTVFGGASSAMQPRDIIEIKVDRPFYAFDMKDNFPLFVCKVNNPIA